MRNDAELLARAAARAAIRPDYLGCLLDRYAHLEGLSKTDLAKRLNLRAVEVTRLALCLKPRDQHFASDINAICGKFPVEPQSLAEIIRVVDSVQTMATGMTGSSDSGVLMAARGRKSKPKARRKTQQDAKRKKS